MSANELEVLLREGCELALGNTRSAAVRRRQLAWVERVEKTLWAAAELVGPTLEQQVTPSEHELDAFHEALQEAYGYGAPLTRFQSDQLLRRAWLLRDSLLGRARHTLEGR